MSGHIQDLPDEVLTYVLSLVSPYKDLHSANQVCKQWRRCVSQVIHERKTKFSKAVNQKKLLWTKAEFQEDKIISRRYSHSGFNILSNEKVSFQNLVFKRNFPFAL